MTPQIDGPRSIPWRALLSRLPRVLLAIAAVVLMARTERFFTPATLSSILAAASFIGVLAVGQAFVLIGGGFDLSQGAILALTAATTAWVATSGAGPVGATAVALGVGLLLGSANGALVAIVRTNPFVTTLSTLLVFRGATFVLLGGMPIPKVTTFEGLNRGITVGGTLLAWRGFVFLGVAGVAWLVLRRSVFGQHVYATGGNRDAARLSGVRTVRVELKTYALSGLSAGVAAILLLSWLRQAGPTTGEGYELSSIAACVVGGISLGGGAGSVIGAAAGCLLLQALGTLITMSGFPDAYRTLVTGSVILTFAAADALARRRDRA